MTVRKRESSHFNRRRDSWTERRRRRRRRKKREPTIVDRTKSFGWKDRCGFPEPSGHGDLCKLQARHLCWTVITSGSVNLAVSPSVSHILGNDPDERCALRHSAREWD